MHNREEQLRHELALNRVQGLSASHKSMLCHRLGSAVAVFNSPASSLLRFGLSRAVMQALQSPDWRAVERDLAWSRQNDHHILGMQDPAYPALLKEIADPPFLLFVRGNTGILDCLQISIVGTRKPTASGRQIARRLATDLAAYGLVITSGLATGIDSMSHQGALEGGGWTVAVLGNGADVIYPRGNARLVEKILERGAVVTEYSPGTPPRKQNFPARNRIISGLSVGTIVVEAAIRSGSLITARTAVEQGRDVFAVPGSTLNPVAHGCHWLIKQGARLTESATDILEELSFEMRRAQPVATGQNAGEPAGAGSKAEEAVLLEAIGFEPISVDELVRTSGLTAAEVSSMLLNMELSGLIESQLDGTYIRVAT